MPIIINSDNPLKDIDLINKEIKTTEHSPKFFSSRLTGKGAKTGLINENTKTLNDQLNEHGSMILKDTRFTTRVLDDLIKETMHIGAYSSQFNNQGEPTALYVDRSEHERRYNKNANEYDIESTLDLETINPLSINDFTFEMKLPLDTVLWDLNTVEDWDIIDENVDKTLRGKVLFSHLTMFHHEEAKATGRKKHHYPFILTPFLMLSVSDNNAKQTHLTINKNTQDSNAHRVRIVPIRIETGSNQNQLSYEFGHPSHPYLDKEALESIKDFTDDFVEFGINHYDIGSLQVKGIMKLVHDTNIYQTITKQAERYKDSSMNQFVRIIKELKNMYNNDPAQAPSNARKDLIASLFSLINNLEYIEEQGGKINTEDLNTVYETIMDMKLITDSDKDSIVRQSLRLLLAHRLSALDEAKHNGKLYKFDPKIDKVTENVEKSTHYSKQQKKIILTKEPLSIGQAGAGSGKSHTVTGRIHYLEAQKEDLDKVLVLSFTNVAAQNISNRFKGIKSKTLADMFHSIYQQTFTEQHLSTPGTLMNSLTLLNPYSPFFTQTKGLDGAEVEKVIGRLKIILGKFVFQFGKNNDVQSNMRLLMNLVDEQTEIVVALLDATEQTTLELEPIIIHNYLNNRPNELSFPEEFKELNMIITDESQDISTFEYIMLIDMALFFGCQLLIVGDGSQTLYEFRNSDPRYLNALEASNIFETYKLETNYRSDPEILAYANQFLQVIEANDIANIQLRANTLRQASLKSFKEKVTVYSALPSDIDRKGRQQILEDHMLTNDDFIEWFYEKIDNGDQVAFLAHTRRDVEVAQDALTELLELHGITEEVTNIVSKRAFEKKYISDTLIAIREDFIQLNPGSPTFERDAYNLIDEDDQRIVSAMGFKNKSQYLSRNVQDVRDTFAKVIRQPMIQMMRQEVASRKRHKVEVMNHILQSMLREETRQNNMQHVLDPKQELDLSDKQVIVSTIHAAKGLEFDHTIVLNHETKSSTRADRDKMQEQLRMLFVAVSRAKTSQWIINTQLDVPKSVSSHMSAMYESPMTTAYLRVLDELREEEKKSAQI